MRTFIALLRPQLEQLTGRGTLDHLQRVDVEAIHVIIERETVDAVVDDRRKQDPTAEWHDTCNEQRHPLISVPGRFLQHVAGIAALSSLSRGGKE